MARPDLYTPVHKMQRARLFTLTIAAGTIAAHDPVARTVLATAVDAATAEIAAHGHHEDQFIHPLLRNRAPSLASELEAAHIELDGSLDTLRRTAAAFADEPADANQLHRALSAFTAGYLRHLDREESEALPVLWSTCSDDELTDAFTAFRGSRSDLANLASTLAMTPTLNPTERAGMLVERSNDVDDLIATLLDPLQLGDLHLRSR